MLMVYHLSIGGLCRRRPIEPCRLRSGTYFVFVNKFLPVFGVADPFKKHKMVTAYWTAIQHDPSAHKMLQRIQEALTKAQDNS